MSGAAEPEAERPPRTSQVLCDFAQRLNVPRVSVAEIVSALADRGLGVLIAIFALPNIFPSTVPFGNVATGLPVVVFSVQLTLGMQHLILPNFIGLLSVRSGIVKAVAPRVAKVLSWVERLLHPRQAWVTGAVAERIVGAICILLSVVSTLPIPLAHNLPAFGLMLIGLGLIERDGIAILAGLAIGLFGVGLLLLVMFGLAHGLMGLMDLI